MKLFDVYPLYNVEPVKALGSVLWDREGKEYLDLYGGHAVISIGHTHPHYVACISEQLQKVGFYSNSVVISLQHQLAQKLGELSGYPHYDLFLVNSGAEANENALKLASFKKEGKVLVFSKAFHGRTSLAVAATDNPSIIAPLNQTEDIVFLPFNDLDALEVAFAKYEVCAVMVEGMQGVAGVFVPSVPFLQKARALCTEHNATLILDEVQSGYGRSGKFFAHQLAGIEADIITIAKGMGNGFPIGGVLISPAFKAKHGLLGTTFGGNHLACAAGLAVLEVIEQEQLMDHAANLGAWWKAAIEAIPGVVEVRGHGLMLGVGLSVPAGPVRDTLLREHHLFTGSASDKHTIRLLPALNLTQEHAQRFVDALMAVLAKTEAAVPA